MRAAAGGYRSRDPVSRGCAVGSSGKKDTGRG